VVWVYYSTLGTLVENHLYNAGKTSNVKTVEVTKPPTTTVARGLCTSLPIPVENKSGIIPSAAARAVINTGRNLKLAPLIEASSTANPSIISWFMYVTNTIPLSSAIPNSAIKPTEAGTERFCPVIHNPTIPPTRARGIFDKIKAEFQSFLVSGHNRRIIFSGPFGIRKTYLLNEF
jgi:hypothetical protein